MLFGMALGQPIGFVESLLRLIGLEWAVPTFSTVSHRQKTLQVNIPYRGSHGTFGSWRLMRRVFGHLIATGAVALTDDLLGDVAGGGVLSKLSRHFGEGVVNGVLTARVDVAHDASVPPDAVRGPAEIEGDKSCQSGTDGAVWPRV